MSTKPRARKVFSTHPYKLTAFLPKGFPLGGLKSKETSHTDRFTTKEKAISEAECYLKLGAKSVFVDFYIERSYKTAKRVFERVVS